MFPLVSSLDIRRPLGPWRVPSRFGPDSTSYSAASGRQGLGPSRVSPRVLWLELKAPWVERVSRRVGMGSNLWS